MSADTTPTLADHKRSARLLKKAHAFGQAEAAARVARFVNTDKTLTHADFLFVIAREAGHESWPKLKFALESVGLSRAERAERLKFSLFQGQHWITEKLLTDEPSLKDHNLGLQIALYDAAAVEAALETDRLAATRKIGVRTPLLHLAFSREIHRSPEKSDQMQAIAELLLSAGADVNEGYPPEPDADHQVSALYGALCHADNFELGRWLLENGANPNDDESLYHSTELGHTRALELLLRYGARPNGTNALPRALDFDNEDMVRLLLEAGADPNVTEPDHPSGMPMDSIPALHQAARRGASVKTVELLVKHGANPDAVWEGHTPYALALIHGHTAIAEQLSALGHGSDLSPTEAVLAACARGNAPVNRLDGSSLRKGDRELLTTLAFLPGKLAHMKALVAAGLDPDLTDFMGLPPLHISGWNGLADEMAYFLSLGPDLERKNKYGGDALGTVLHGAEFAPRQKEADHIACARLLLEAGSVLTPELIAGCGSGEMVQFLEEWRGA